MDGGEKRAVHPAVEPLSYLLGTWRGQGEGGFPTISSFRYGEELHFSHSGYKVDWKMDDDVDVYTTSNNDSRTDLCFCSYMARATSITTWSEKPVIAYSQKTWKLDSGEPMHAESGYWRPKPDGTIEVVIAQSTGLVEVQKGTYNGEDRVVKLRSEIVGNASKVKDITRVFEVINGELSYVVEMATNLTSLQQHLKASLVKF